MRFTLEELFELQGTTTLNEQLSHLITLARWRVIGVFNEEQVYYRKRYRSSNGRILHARAGLDGLLHYVQGKIRNSFVSPHDLARRFWGLSPNDQRAICKIAEEQLLIAALLQMSGQMDGDLWYDHGHGTWQIPNHAQMNRSLHTSESRAR